MDDFLIKDKLLALLRRLGSFPPYSYIRIIVQYCRQLLVEPAAAPTFYGEAIHLPALSVEKGDGPRLTLAL